MQVIARSEYRQVRTSGTSDGKAATVMVKSFYVQGKSAPLTVNQH